MKSYSLNKRETAIILAALRYYQFDPPENDWIEMIATNMGSHDSMDLMEIDSLCERLNTERKA